MAKQQLDLDNIAAELNMNVFQNEQKIPFVKINIDGKRREVHPLFSSVVEGYITANLYRKSKLILNDKQVASIQKIIAMDASNRTESVWVRVAPFERGYQIDLNNERGEAIFVTADHWWVDDATVNFYRARTSRELPRPERGGTYALFGKHFRANPVDLQLMVGFMLSAFRPSGPHAGLALSGEQGSAKSTTLQMIKMLIDPAAGAKRALSNSEHDLFIAAQSVQLLSFDNLSKITLKTSDALCRLTTGGAFATRSLYKNDEEFMIELCKPIILNGITQVVLKSDLVSRCFSVSLPRIEDHQRKTEAEVMVAFEKDMPLMLGVLMNGLVSAVKNNDTVKLPTLPRMADVVTWCTAAEEGMGWETGSFSKAVRDNQDKATVNILTNDPVAVAVIAYMSDQKGNRVAMPATQLMNELSLGFYKPEWTGNAWPSTPSVFSGALKKLAPGLRLIGLNIPDEEDRDSKERRIVIEKMPHFERDDHQSGSFGGGVGNDAHDGNDASRGRTVH